MIPLISSLSGARLLKPLGAVAAVLVLSGFAYFKGAEHEREKCDAAELAQVVDEQNAAITRLNAQLETAQLIRDEAAARSEADEEEIRNWKEQANAFKREVANRPKSCGAISTADAERLRRIGD